MTDTLSSAQTIRGLRPRVSQFLHTVQWCVFGIVLLFLLQAGLTHMSRHRLDGYPTELLYPTLILFGISGIILCPPVFFRLPRILKLTSYGALVASLILWSAYGTEIQEAYDQTAIGKQALARRRRKRRATHGRLRSGNNSMRRPPVMQGSGWPMTSLPGVSPSSAATFPI